MPEPLTPPVTPGFRMTAEQMISARTAARKPEQGFMGIGREVRTRRGEAAAKRMEGVIKAFNTADTVISAITSKEGMQFVGQKTKEKGLGIFHSVKNAAEGVARRTANRVDTAVTSAANSVSQFAERTADKGTAIAVSIAETADRAAAAGVRGVNRAIINPADKTVADVRGGPRRLAALVESGVSGAERGIAHALIGMGESMKQAAAGAQIDAQGNRVAAGILRYEAQNRTAARLAPKPQPLTIGG